MLTPNGDGYFIAATKDTLTILKGATHLATFPSSSAVMQDGDYIVISGAGITKKYPIDGFDSIYAVSGENSPALILKSANWIISLLEEEYDITITNTGKQVSLNGSEIDAVGYANLKIYFGTIQFIRPDNEVLLKVVIVDPASETTTVDRAAWDAEKPQATILNNITFNNRNTLTSTGTGEILFSGFEFTYTENS